MKQFNSWIIVLLTSVLFLQCNQPSKPHSASAGREPQMDGAQQAVQQDFMMTRDPQLNYVPAERLVAAKAYMQSLQAIGRINALAWTERGPNNIGGRTRAILVDKRDPSGNTVF